MLPIEHHAKKNLVLAISSYWYVIWRHERLSWVILQYLCITRTIGTCWVLNMKHMKGTTFLQKYIHTCTHHVPPSSSQLLIKVSDFSPTSGPLSLVPLTWMLFSQSYTGLPFSLPSPHLQLHRSSEFTFKSLKSTFQAHSSLNLTPVIQLWTSHI